MDEHAGWSLNCSQLVEQRHNTSRRLPRAPHLLVRQKSSSDFFSLVLFDEERKSVSTEKHREGEYSHVSHSYRICEQ